MDISTISQWDGILSILCPDIDPNHPQNKSNRQSLYVTVSVMQLADGQTDKQTNMAAHTPRDHLVRLMSPWTSDSHSDSSNHRTGVLDPPVQLNVNIHHHSYATSETKCSAFQVEARHTCARAQACADMCASCHFQTRLSGFWQEANFSSPWS